VPTKNRGFVKYSSSPIWYWYQIGIPHSYYCEQVTCGEDSNYAEF